MHIQILQEILSQLKKFVLVDIVQGSMGEHVYSRSTYYKKIRYFHSRRKQSQAQKIWHQ